MTPPRAATRRRRRGHAAAPLLLSLVLGCVPSAGPEDIASAPGALVPPTLHGIRWALDWELDGVVWTPAGLSVTNDLGVTFVVSAGLLLDYSLVAVPCEDTVVDAGGERWLGIGTARADHSAFADPSSADEQQVEAWASPSPRSLGERSFTPTTYCRVHWLVARSDLGTTSDGVDVGGVSLSVVASWSGPDGDGVLDLRTDWTNGALLDLRIDAQQRPSTTALTAEITVVRSLSGLFDGVDPSVMTELEIAWALLENLIASATLRVVVEGVQPVPTLRFSAP